MADLYSWGDGADGLQGRGSTDDVLSPTLISGGWSSISSSWDHVLGIKEDGSLWAWGRNDHNQLGTGGVTTPATLVPTRVGLATDWAKISAGYRYSLALKNDGSFWAWGANGPEGNLA